MSALTPENLPVVKSAMFGSEPAQITAADKVFNEWLDHAIATWPSEQREFKDYSKDFIGPVFVAKLPDYDHYSDDNTAHCFFMSISGTFIAVDKVAIVTGRRTPEEDSATKKNCWYFNMTYFSEIAEQQQMGKFTAALAVGFYPMIGTRPHFVTHFFPYMVKFYENMLKPDAYLRVAAGLDDVGMWVSGFEPMIALHNAMLKHFTDFCPCLPNTPSFTFGQTITSRELFNDTTSGWMSFYVKGHCLTFLFTHEGNGVKLCPRVDRTLHQHFIQHDLNLYKLAHAGSLNAQAVNKIFEILEKLPFKVAPTTTKKNPE